jgi:predicted transcriptional regulator
MKIIKDRVIELGWSYQKTARKAGIGYSAMLKIAAGETVKIATLRKVFDALGLEYMAFMKGGSNER